MKKVFALSLMVACTGATFAQVFEVGGTLEERFISMDGSSSITNVPTNVYSGIPGPYFAAPAANGLLGFDDYNSTSVGSFTLNQMRFVGGVTAVGGTLQFEFYDSTGTTLINGFQSTFGSAGNFIWTISGLSGLNIVLPQNGVLRVRAMGTTTGQWFLSSTAPSIGTNNPGYGGAMNGTTPLYHTAELQAVPEPGTMAALGLGAVAMLRKRRKK